jgi:hypothetical protein
MGFNSVFKGLKELKLIYIKLHTTVRYPNVVIFPVTSKVAVMG